MKDLHSEKMLAMETEKVLESFIVTVAWNGGAEANTGDNYIIYPPYSGRKGNYQTWSMKNAFGKSLEAGFIYRFTVLDDGFNHLSNRGMSVTQDEFSLDVLYAGCINVFPLCDSNGNLINSLKKGNVGYLRLDAISSGLTLWRAWNSNHVDNATTRIKIDKLPIDQIKAKKFFWYNYSTMAYTWTETEVSPGGGYVRRCWADGY